MGKDLNDYKCSNLNCCILKRNNSVYSVQGKSKGRSTNYRLKNSSKFFINQYVVDDCVLANLSEDKKCDYLFLVKRMEDNVEIKDGFFVEMKGSDFIHAIKQLLNSIKELKENINGQIFARIVLTKNSIPNYKQDKHYRNLKGMLLDNFTHKNILLEDTV